MDAANQLSQIKINKIEKRPSIFKRTTSAASIGSRFSGEKGNKRISFQDDKCQDVIELDSTKLNKIETKEPCTKDSKLKRISEISRVESTSSSSSADDCHKNFHEIVHETNAPTERKKAFLVSQLGIDNPTFHDDKASYVLDPSTLTTSRLNSNDDCERL